MNFKLEGEVIQGPRSPSETLAEEIAAKLKSEINLFKPWEHARVAASEGPRFYNTERCKSGNCVDPNCQNYHTECERRCNDPRCQGTQNPALCSLLHIDPAVKEFASYPAKVWRVDDIILRLSTKYSPSQRAEILRVVVYDLQIMGPHAKSAIFRILELFPFVQEILLPDRKWNPFLLVAIEDIMTTLREKAPRFRTVIFQDGYVHHLW
mmetsp:Transcript_86686/g.190294  ORF Transcript_86686/g.190294 Transcript_86686/m.190294 type:complete len:209 (-) Transcript_86686:305-931(-)